MERWARHGQNLGSADWKASPGTGRRSTACGGRRPVRQHCRWWDFCGLLRPGLQAGECSHLLPHAARSPHAFIGKLCLHAPKHMPAKCLPKLCSTKRFAVLNHCVGCAAWLDYSKLLSSSMTPVAPRCVILLFVAAASVALGAAGESRGVGCM
jgi:hypothetical protein